MGFGASLILIALGAILTWAVTARVSGVELQTVGVILLVVGIVRLLLSLVFWSPWSSPWPWRRERTTSVDRY